MRDDEPSPVWMSLLITHWDPWGTRSLYFNTRCACFPGVCVECLIGKQKKPILLVEMESLQFVGCSWFIGLIGLVSDSPRNKSTENRTCAQSCPSPVSSRPHLDAPGVHSLALFEVTEPSSVPYRAPSACAKRAAYPDPPPVIPVPDTGAAQARARPMSRRRCGKSRRSSLRPPPRCPR
jgi:hypothetical protein